MWVDGGIFLIIIEGLSTLKCRWRCPPTPSADPNEAVEDTKNYRTGTQLDEKAPRVPNKFVEEVASISLKICTRIWFGLESGRYTEEMRGRIRRGYRGGEEKERDNRFLRWIREQMNGFWGNYLRDPRWCRKVLRCTRY